MQSGMAGGSCAGETLEENLALEKASKKRGDKVLFSGFGHNWTMSTIIRSQDTKASEAIRARSRRLLWLVAFIQTVIVAVMFGVMAAVGAFEDEGFVESGEFIGGMVGLALGLAASTLYFYSIVVFSKKANQLDSVQNWKKVGYKSSDRDDLPATLHDDSASTKSANKVVPEGSLAATDPTSTSPSSSASPRPEAEANAKAPPTPKKLPPLPPLPPLPC